MVLVEVPVVLDSSQFSHESHVRSGGLHLSNVIQSIEQDIWKVDRGDNFDEQDLEAYRIGGFLFEWGLYEKVIRERGLERLGEFELDGIKMTPDAVDLQVSPGKLIESKCTWQTMNKHIVDEHDNWWTQIKGYLKALGLKEVELWVYFINGGYGKDRKPKLKKWEATFDQRELDANWRMIVNHVRWMRQQEKYQKMYGLTG